MNIFLLQTVLDIVFSYHLIYLAPVIGIISVLIFTDKIVDVVQSAVRAARR